MPLTVSILLDKPGGVYFGGQVLSGKVKIENNSEKLVRAIYIEISGHGKVQWDNKTKKKKFKPESYQGSFVSHEIYLSSKTCVFNTTNGILLTLTPGTHEYAFSAVLPPDLPSSIFASCGHVKYEVIVKLQRPLRFDSVIKEPFTILRKVDLNLNPINMHPIEDDEIQHLCFCCCVSGPILSKLWIPFRGYAPGQILQTTIFIDNDSSYDIIRCKLQFIQRIIFTCKSPYKVTRKDDIIIYSKSLEGAQRFTKKKIYNAFQVPLIQPSTTDDKAIIKIEYYLKAIILTEFVHKNKSIIIPIVIGTEPLVNQSINQNSNMPIMAQPTSPLTMPTVSNTENDQLLCSTNIDPPTYEDASRGLVANMDN